MRALLLSSLLALAAAPATAGVLLVVNKEAHNVSVLDLAAGTRLATIPTGNGPHEIAAAPDGALAVATNYGRAEAGDSLTVIDVARRAPVRTVALGEYRRPHGVAFFPDSRRVAVTTEGSGHLLVVDAREGRVEKAIATGQDVSHMVALAPDAKRAYVANIGSGSLSVIDVEVGKLVRNVATGAGAEGVAVTPDGREVWVSNREAGTVSIVDAGSLAVTATLPSAGFPIRVAMAPDGRHALVTNAKAGELAVFDVAARREVRRLKVAPDEGGMLSRFFGQRGSFPIGVTFSPAGDRAFVALAGGDRVVVIRASDWSVSGAWDTGAEPDGMAIVAK